MSRAINVAMTEPKVLAACAKNGATVSAIEALESGGTRVVLMNAEGASVMRQAFGSKLLTGPVRRTPFRARWSS